MDFQLFADDTVFDILLAVAAIHASDFRSASGSNPDDKREKLDSAAIMKESG